MGWHKLSASLGSSCKGTCGDAFSHYPKIAASTCCWEGSSGDFVPPFFLPSPSGASLQGAVSPAFFGMLPAGEVRFLGGLLFCFAQTHRPERSGPCTVALKTLLTLVLEVYPCLPELSHHVPRVPGWGNSCFPLRGDRTYSESSGCPDTSPSSLDRPPESLAAMLAPSPLCTDVDPVHRATTTFSSSFIFCAMPVAAIALSICSCSSAASAKIVSASSAILIFICRGRGSLHPGGRPHHLLGAGLSSGSLSSSGGGLSSGCCPAILPNIVGVLTWFSRVEKARPPYLEACGSVVHAAKKGVRHRHCSHLSFVACAVFSRKLSERPPCVELRKVFAFTGYFVKHAPHPSSNHW